MNVKFKDEIDFIAFDNLMEEDANVVFELYVWFSTFKRKLLGFLIFFFHFKEI